MISKLYLLLFISLVSTSTFAFKMTPMSVSFSPHEKINSKMFTLSNDSKKPIAVQVSIAKRVMDIYGKETHPEDEDSFMIYPSQLILKGGERRNVKVRWTGEQKLKNELAYRLIAEQLPIDVDKKNSKDKKMDIKILLRYIGSIYIKAKNMSSNVLVEQININKDKKRIEILVHNKGNQHQVLKELKVRLSQKGKKITLEGSKKLKGFFSENILASSKRLFYLDVPHTFDLENKIEVRLEFDK